ncbi:uncharacterized protein LOC129728568 [Wyeomyia smithii]|uniref:uncharacterized protein LOC129728568 n=1 Tax=Wyeomyia smithii TaxID=174621 RepID=UPI002467BD1B|nr:uncharacterized protein LOC129728568 [Wyeomyia smithii]
MLVDPEFHTPEKVDLLIGGELFFDILKPSSIHLADGLPQLRDTHFGWVVAGVIIDPHVVNVSLQYSHTTVEDIERKMQQFWQTEEVPNVPKLSTAEINLSQLGNCRCLALKRFLMLEKRLIRNPELQTQYVNFIREYESLGHCREVAESEDVPNQQVYYLPHHAVLRPSSSSTKYRVVFDASAKSSPLEVSLNDVLQIGPVVQNDLYHIVLRFRTFRVAFTADISKMYRQILAAPSDRRFLRIFWREKPSLPLRVLELCTVTYGTASAPYQATRCLLQLAEEDGREFPIATRIVKEETYMDDVLSGADSVEQALEAQNQLKQLLHQGGFPIHKWCSNSQEFLEHIPVDEQEKMDASENRGVNSAIKVLGLRWNPTTDSLSIANHTNPSVPKLLTKRILYSEIAKFFDPLGLVSPVIVKAKLLAQQQWQAKIGWDDPVDDNIKEQCAVTYDVHGFSDASTVAYGACIYLRSLFADGPASLCLLTSKSKLAPLEELSIPRKELCAALLLSRLMQKVLPALTMKIQETVLWSDSTIVLAWIKKPLNQLQQYVRNRIALIQEQTSEHRWKHVRSQQNPADIISRGQLPEYLQNNPLWWSGPEFLNREKYEVDVPETIPDEELPELKSMVTVSNDDGLLAHFYKQSSFHKIQRVVGYILRFAKNCEKKRAERELGTHLTVSELRQSTETIAYVVQQFHFADEIKRVVTNQPCRKLGNLRPVYVNKLLRVGGRLDRSQQPFENRHPIILPDKDPVVRLLVQQMHIELLHWYFTAGILLRNSDQKATEANFVAVGWAPITTKNIEACTKK